LWSGTIEVSVGGGSVGGKRTNVESLPSSGMQNFVGNSEAKSNVAIDSLRTTISVEF